MSEGQFLLTITVLPVNDIERAAEWYRHALDLEIVYLHKSTCEGEPTNYAVLRREGIAIHLVLDEPAPYEQAWTKSGTGYLYLIVRDIEKMFDEVKSRGVTVTRGLEIENWGVRGFNLTDPCGNAIHIEQRE